MTSTVNLQRDAEIARSGLSRALDELHGTMTATAIRAGATTLAKEGSSAVARAAVERATARPLAALLIGAGFFLLLRPKPAARQLDWNSGTRSSKNSLQESEAAMSGPTNSVRSAVHGAQEGVSDVVAKGQEVLASGQERVKDLVEDGRHRIGERFSEIQDSASLTKDSLYRFVQEQPVLAAACAVAVGAAIGAVLPATEVERSYLAEAGAKAGEKGRQVASQVADTLADQLVGREAEVKVAKVAEVLTKDISKSP